MIKINKISAITINLVRLGDNLREKISMNIELYPATYDLTSSLYLFKDGVIDHYIDQCLIISNKKWKIK